MPTTNQMTPSQQTNSISTELQKALSSVSTFDVQSKIQALANSQHDTKKRDAILLVGAYVVYKKAKVVAKLVMLGTMITVGLDLATQLKSNTSNTPATSNKA